MVERSTHLLVIDPQNDFMDEPGAALPVRGAGADMARLAATVHRLGPALAGIHVTLDTHRPIDVAHPSFWTDVDGRPPAPFTLVTAEDVRSGIWRPRRDDQRARMLAYTTALERNGRYGLMIWPEHCLLGSPGHAVVAELKDELDRWERDRGAPVDYTLKGLNPFTEHYGALAAEVPDPDDATTALNTDLLGRLRSADILLVAGEASSHCVLATLEQIVANWREAELGRVHILTDCMSPVAATPGSPDFPAVAASFQKAMAARGLVLTTSDNVAG